MVIYFHLYGYRVPDLNENDNRLNLNGNNWNEFNDNRYSFGIALAQDNKFMPKTYSNQYNKIISMGNLTLAWRNARKGKTRKSYVVEFEKDLQKNLLALHTELKAKIYYPRPLTAFIVRDPKTRLIHKSDFRDRIVHHALVYKIEPLFDKTFIHDSYANRTGKGALKAIERFEQFAVKVSRNGSQKGWFNSNQIKGYCFKADIKHYFQTVDYEVLLCQRVSLKPHTLVCGRHVEHPKIPNKPHTLVWGERKDFLINNKKEDKMPRYNRFNRNNT